jgi:hypothetical protein
MKISQFARLAVPKPTINHQYHLGGLRETLKAKNPMDLLIDTLEESGAQVYVKKHDYFISERLGGIPVRLKGKPRHEVRKSYAWLRVLPKKEFMVRAELAVADRGAICIHKKEMEMLQLSNLCLKAIVLIHEDDVFANMAQLPYSNHAKSFQEGYLIAGPYSNLSLIDNSLRKIPDLTVYIIARKQDSVKKGKKYISKFNTPINKLT